MKAFKPLLLSLLAGLSTLIGYIFTYIKIKNKENLISFSLSLSMIIMISISLIELLPNSSNKILLNYGIIYGYLIVLLVFLLGYLTVYLINNRISNEKSLYKIGIISFISLLLHNFPEGIAVFISSYNDIKIGLKICISIIMHNIVEGMSISLPLYYGGVKRAEVFKLTFYSSIAEPLGALLSYLFLKEYMSELLLSFTLVFVSGLMISLSINEIYNELKKYNNKKYIVLGMIFGIIASLLLKLIGEGTPT